MKKLKKFFSSKINWLSIAAMLIAIQEGLAKLDFTLVDAKSWSLFIISLLVIICRAYITKVATNTEPENKEE